MSISGVAGTTLAYSNLPLRAPLTGLLLGVGVPGVYFAPALWPAENPAKF
jgi:hypothetical protein